MTLLAIIILSVILLSLVIGASYNSFVHRKNAMLYAYHGLETMLQKRHDLLPKLAEVVQTSAYFEEQLLERTNQLMLAQKEIKSLPAPEMARKENEIVRSMQQITKELSRDAGVRQHKSFMHLQRSIADAEEQIAAARRAYNASVMEYNNAIEMFPTAVFATLLQYKPEKPIEIAVLDADYTVEN
ncbi:MAG: LemA family protein [Saprospiraceae bacterium]|nr:LemA family protein [Lewinella sp.]